jgi:hypothetical protein
VIAVDEFKGIPVSKLPSTGRKGTGRDDHSFDAQVEAVSY